MRAMLLLYAGEAVFEFNEVHPVVGLTENNSFAETKRKRTAYLRPWQCNEEYEIFKFRQTEQMSPETLYQFNARRLAEQPVYLISEIA